MVGGVVVFGRLGVGRGGQPSLHGYTLIHMQDAAMDAMQNSKSKGGRVMRRIRLISSSGQTPLSFRVTMKKPQTVFCFFWKKTAKKNKKPLPPS